MEQLTEVMDKNTQAIRGALQEVLQMQTKIINRASDRMMRATPFHRSMHELIQNYSPPSLNHVKLYDQDTEGGHRAVLDVTLDSDSSMSHESAKSFLKSVQPKWQKLMEHLGATVEYIAQNKEGKPAIRITFSPENNFETAYQSVVNGLQSLPEKMNTILQNSEKIYNARAAFVATLEKDKIPVRTGVQTDGAPKFTIGDPNLTGEQRKVVDTAWKDYLREQNEAEAAMQQARS